MRLIIRWSVSGVIHVGAMMLVASLWVVVVDYLVFPLLSAPAPFKRPARPFSPVGNWDATWGQTRCEMTFVAVTNPLHRDTNSITQRGGVYSCLYCGVKYQGTWTYREGVLRVKEYPVYDPGQVMEWGGEVKWDGKRVTLKWRELSVEMCRR